MLIKKAGWVISLFLLFYLIGQNVLQAIQPTTEKDDVFLRILAAAYQASCSNAEWLHDYYLSDAEIIHDGRQLTLDETIKELKQSIAPLSGLTCVYQPKVRASRTDDRFAYLVVRETLILEAHETGKKEIQQICTYVFSRTGSRWMIAHDHCSTIPGLVT